MSAAQAHHTPHESTQRRHAQQGQAQQVHATRAWEAQARIPQACTASACTAGTRNASMGDTSTTTQACTAPAQSTGRCTPAMSTTLTSGCRTIWANAAQVHHTPSTRVHSSSTHRMGTRSRHGLEHAPVNDKLSGRGNAAAHQCGATEHRETDATSRHASAARATQSRRTPHRRQPHQPRSAAPHPPSTRDGHTRHAAATPPRRQTRTQPTARRGTTEPVAAHTRACGPRPQQPLPTHGHPMCPIDFLPLLQCAAGRLRTAKPPCPSDTAPRRARDRRTAHRRRLQPRRSPAAPSPSISVHYPSP